MGVAIPLRDQTSFLTDKMQSDIDTNHYDKSFILLDLLLCLCVQCFSRPLHSNNALNTLQHSYSTLLTHNTSSGAQLVEI